VLGDEGEQKCSPFFMSKKCCAVVHVENFTRVKLLLLAAALVHVENFTRVKTQQRCSTVKLY
jgi:hypothetical protein